MAPGGIEPPHAASKAAALSAELRGRAQRGYLGWFHATLCRLGGGSSVGRAPGCGPGGRGFESRPPPFWLSHAGAGCVYATGSVATRWLQLKTLGPPTSPRAPSASEPTERARGSHWGGVLTRKYSRRIVVRGGKVAG